MTKKDKKKLFIILSAGPSRGMKHTKQCKYLVHINKEPLITRQIRIIEDVSPNCKIRVGLGENAAEIKKILPKRIQTTFCPDYETNNTCATLKKCLIDEAHNKYSSITVICGDILFNHETLTSIKNEEILLTDRYAKAGDLGVNYTLDTVDLVQYGLKNTPWKWGQIFTFGGYNFKNVMNCLAMGDKSKWLLHELLNKLVDEYFTMKVRKNKRALMYDIDSLRDLKFIKKELQL